MSGPPRLILASASPRRRELLAQLGLPFEVIVAGSRSTRIRHRSAGNGRTQRRAQGDWVAARYPEAIVVGADTTVFIDNTVLNKPADLADARAMLRQLAGRTHIVFTGVAVRCVREGLRIDEGVTSEVTFKAFD